MTTMTTRTRASTRVLSISLMPALAARVVSAGTKIRDRGDSVVSLPRQDVPELSSAGGQLRLRLREGPWVRADPVQRSGDQRAPAGRRSLRKEVKGWAPSAPQRSPAIRFSLWCIFCVALIGRNERRRGQGRGC